MGREYQCKECNEWMEGDGHTRVLHCPNAEEDKYYDHEPDAAPVYCDFKDVVDATLLLNGEEITPPPQRMCYDPMNDPDGYLVGWKINPKRERGEAILLHITHTCWSFLMMMGLGYFVGGSENETLFNIMLATAMIGMVSLLVGTYICGKHDKYIPIRKGKKDE